jgi:hypothetical protein
MKGCKNKYKTGLTQNCHSLLKLKSTSWKIK